MTEADSVKHKTELIAVLPQLLKWTAHSQEMTGEFSQATLDNRRDSILAEGLKLIAKIDGSPIFSIRFRTGDEPAHLVLTAQTTDVPKGAYLRAPIGKSLADRLNRTLNARVSETDTSIKIHHLDAERLIYQCASEFLSDMSRQTVRPAQQSGPMEAVAAFDSAYRDCAAKEGWLLSWEPGSQFGDVQIQRIDDPWSWSQDCDYTPKQLANDEEAWMVVFQGNEPHHREAVDILAAHNSKEHEFIGKYVTATALDRAMAEADARGEITLTLECKIQPWHDDGEGYLHKAEPLGETEWKMQWPLDRPLPTDDSEEINDLRFTPNAPNWALQWDGEFTVEITNRDALLEQQKYQNQERHEERPRA